MRRWNGDEDTEKVDEGVSDKQLSALLLRIKLWQSEYISLIRRCTMIGKIRGDIKTWTIKTWTRCMIFFLQRELYSVLVWTLHVYYCICHTMSRSSRSLKVVKGSPIRRNKCIPICYWRKTGMWPRIRTGDKWLGMSHIPRRGSVQCKRLKNILECSKILFFPEVKLDILDLRIPLAPD